MRTPISRIFRQLGFLRFGATGTVADADDERVMHLFRSRAELKKSYNQLQGELQQLRDRLKQQEGVSALAHESLQALRQRLAQPGTAYPALVFFHLRDLWHSAHGLVAGQVQEQRQQREAVERGAFQREDQRSRELRVATLQRSCDELEAAEHAAAAPVQAMAQQLARLQGWWRYPQRRRLRQRMHAATALQVQAGDALQAARNERDLVAGEPEPRFPGLSVPMRRTINVAAIAYAHVLHARIESSGLLEPMRRALATEEVPGEEFGDRNACEQLMEQVQRARWLQQRVTLRDELQQVALGLRPLLRYSSELSSVPDATALAADSGTRVLLENAWEINRLLL